MIPTTMLSSGELAPPQTAKYFPRLVSATVLRDYDVEIHFTVPDFNIIQLWIFKKQAEAALPGFTLLTSFYAASVFHTPLHKIKTLEELNRYWIYFEEYYHNAPHEGIREYYESQQNPVPEAGITPLQEWGWDKRPLTFLDATIVAEASRFLNALEKKQEQTHKRRADAISFGNYRKEGRYPWQTYLCSRPTVVFSCHSRCRMWEINTNKTVCQQSGKRGNH